MSEWASANLLGSYCWLLHQTYRVSPSLFFFSLSLSFLFVSHRLTIRVRDNKLCIRVQHTPEQAPLLVLRAINSPSSCIETSLSPLFSLSSLREVIPSSFILPPHQRTHCELQTQTLNQTFSSSGRRKLLRRIHIVIPASASHALFLLLSFCSRDPMISMIF